MADKHPNLARSTVLAGPAPATSGTTIVVATGDGEAFTPPCRVTVGGWFDPSKLLVIAHPAFKDELRMVRDTNQRPILVESASAATPDTIFGYTARWSRGAAKHATASSAPTGNPLMVVVNRDLLRLGVRSGPESVFIDGRNGLGALTDESILKVRARRAFVLGMQHGAAILEATA